MKDITATQGGGMIHVTVPTMRTTYLRNVMRSNSFEELWPLFKLAHDPCKEITESYAAFHQLREWHKEPRLVLHVGDGAHCRTAALFAFFTQHNNISIDPIVNEEVCSAWRSRYAVTRFAWERSRIENVNFNDIDYRGVPFLITFVHAHVDVDAVLGRLGALWIAAYTCACCQPTKQLGSMYPAKVEGQDWAVLSEKRQFRVLVNPLYQ